MFFIREVVGVVLFNSNKQILLQHRTNNAPTDPSKWTIFGGGVEDKETPLEAVKRELLEE